MIDAEKKVDIYLKILLLLLLLATASTSLITLHWVNTGEPMFLIFSMCFFSLYILFFFSYKAIIRKDFISNSRFFFYSILIIYIPEQIIFTGFGVYQLLLNFSLVMISAIYAFPDHLKKIIPASSIYFFFLIVINIVYLPWRINPFDNNFPVEYQVMATLLPIIIFSFIIFTQNRYKLNVRIFTGFLFSSLVPIIIIGIFNVIRSQSTPFLLNIFKNQLSQETRILQTAVDLDRIELFMIFIFVNSIVLIAKFVSDRITSPLYEVLRSAKRISTGNFNMSPPEETEGEFNYLYKIMYQTSRSLSKIIESFQEEIYEKTKTEEELKKTLSQLYLSEMELNYIAESTTDVIWTMDSDFHFKYVSPASIRYSGYTPEEILKQSMEERYTPETVCFLKDLFAKVKMTEGKQEYKNKRSEYSFELEQYSKDGRIITDDVRATLVYDENGYISEIFGITRDITERKRFEEQLTNTKNKLEETIKDLNTSENNFRFIAENSADVIWTINPQLQVEYVSQSIMELQGYTPEEAINLPWEKKLTQSGMNTFLKISERFLSINGDPEYKNASIKVTDTIEQIHKDGHTFWTEITLNVLFDEKAQIIKAIGVTRNINERKLYEEKINRMNKKLIEANKNLQSLDKLKTELLSNVSHELRTPLAAIKGYCDLLYSEKSGAVNEKQKRQLSVIKKNISELAKLIDDLLSYSRLYFGKNLINKSIFAINELINGSIDSIKEKVIDKKISFEFEPEKTYFVTADYVRIKQVVENLLDNACKFSSENPVIKIQLEKIDKDLKISIIDNGIGIPENLKKFIYDRFYQIDSSTTRKYSGIGLGLSIVKKILDLHNSHIELFSKPEKGTNISFTLKLSDKQEKNSVQDKTIDYDDEKIIRDKNSILIVDDQKDILEFVSEMIQLEGIKTHVHNSSEGILDKINLLNPTLLLLDISLGGEDGIEILKKIRKNNINIPVIILSAFTEEEYRKKAKENGAIDYITKPFDMTILIDKIKKHI